MSKTITRMSLYLALFLLLDASLVTGAFAQETPFFTSGNLVVSVEGCGVHGGTCTTVPNGTGTGTGNSSVGGYGDNQGAPLTLFQYTPTGTASVTFVNSLVLPQAGSGADLPVSGEYGSSSEATLQLSGTGQYLTIMGYGLNATVFNANPNSYSAAANSALAQTGSLTGQSYTPVSRVVTLIDPYGNVNSSTALFNIFNGNNPRSTYTADGTHIYVSGQGTSGDATGGTFYTTLGSGSFTSITGDDAGTTSSQDTRDVQIYNNTLFISMDSKSGSYNRDYIGTMGSPPYTTTYSCATAPGGICPTGYPDGPSEMTGFGNTGGTGKETITTGSNSNGNSLNSGLAINISPENYFFASPSVLYVADSGSPKNSSNTDTVCTNDGGTGSVGDGGLQKWINSQSNGSGTWSLAYTLHSGLTLVLNAACDPNNTSGTTGLIGLAGVVSGSNVYLYATNYTIADLDPTYLYGITDNLTNTTASQASGESFTQLDAAPPDSNFKGVALAPALPAGSATITSSPSGLAFTSTGTGCAPGTYTTPVTLIWTPGNPCSLSVVTPQIVAGAQYVFTQWGDGTTSTTDTVTAPTTSAVYTANFNTTPAGLYSPAPGSTLAGSSATFQWYGPPNNTAFWIDVGSSAGGNNYHQSGSLPTTTLSATVTSLPTDGSTVYVTLYWLINGSWVSNPYTYTALKATGSAAGMITAPIPGSMLTGSSATFVWTAGSGGATAYWLDVGRAAGGNQYLQSGNLGDVMQLTVNGLPTDGSMVFVTLYSLIGGVWAGNAYTYTAFNASGASSCLPTAISPGAGATLSGSSQLFSWTPSQAAGCSTSVTGYWLDAGTAASENEYYQSGNLGTATSVTAVNLPQDGSAVQVTLWTLYGGQWYSSVYNYTAQ